MQFTITPIDPLVSNLKLILDKDLDTISELFVASNYSQSEMEEFLSKIGAVLYTYINDSNPQIKIQDLEPVSKFEFTEKDVEIINYLAGELRK